MNTLSKTFVTLIALLCLGLASFVLAYDWLFDVLPPAITLRLPNLDPEPAAALPAPSAAVDNSAGGDVAAIPGLEGSSGDAVAAVAETPTPVPPTATPEPTEVVAEVVEADSAESQPEPTPTLVPPTATPTEIPPTPTPTPIPLPETHLIEGLVNVPQSFNNCGPANLSIVLDYHGDSTTQADAAVYLKPNPNDRNVSPWQINDFVNAQTGLKSTAHSGGTLEMVKALVANGLPVVVERGADFNDGQGWYGHYLTVYAYDDTTETLLAMDTYGEGGWSAEGKSFTYAEVKETWKHFNYTFYVVYPEAQEQLVFELIGPTLVDERTMWENAIAIANADIAADSTDRWAWFNLGTSLTWMGVLEGAEDNVDAAQRFYQDGAAAFDQARSLELPWRMLWYQHRPYLAYYRVGRYQDIIDLADATLETRGGQNVEETYYWKGNALASTGDAVGAGEAYRDSLRVNENFYYAQWALDYLTRDQ